MGMFGEKSIEERTDNAIDDAFPSKPGFSSVHQGERDSMRSSLNSEFGINQEEDDA